MLGPGGPVDSKDTSNGALIENKELGRQQPKEGSRGSKDEEVLLHARMGDWGGRGEEGEGERKIERDSQGKGQQCPTNCPFMPSLTLMVWRKSTLPPARHFTHTHPCHLLLRLTRSRRGALSLVRDGFRRQHVAVRADHIVFANARQRSMLPPTCPNMPAALFCTRHHHITVSHLPSPSPLTGATWPTLRSIESMNLTGIEPGVFR